MRNSRSNVVQLLLRTCMSALLNFAAVFFLCAATALSQTPSKSDPRSAPATKSDAAVPASPVELTRARRAAMQSAQAASASSDAAQQQSAVTKDAPRLVQLREQIKTTDFATERTRLQRTLVDYLVALNRKGEAVAELRSMMREDRFDPAGFYNIGNALARLDDSNTAVDAYRKAIEQKHGNYSRASNNMGVVLLRLDRTDEAQQAFTNALRQESFRYAEASYNLGRVYNMRGETNAAIQEWARTLTLDPGHADAALALAHAYAAIGNTTQALTVLDTYTARHGASNEFALARKEITAGSEATVTNEPKKAGATTSAPNTAPNP